MAFCQLSQPRRDVSLTWLRPRKLFTSAKYSRFKDSWKWCLFVKMIFAVVGKTFNLSLPKRSRWWFEFFGRLLFISHCVHNLAVHQKGFLNWNDELLPQVSESANATLEIICTGISPFLGVWGGGRFKMRIHHWLTRMDIWLRAFCPKAIPSEEEIFVFVSVVCVFPIGWKEIRYSSSNRRVFREMLTLLIWCFPQRGERSNTRNACAAYTTRDEAEALRHLHKPSAQILMR